MIVHLQATHGTIKLDQHSLDLRGLIGLPNTPACVPPLLGCYRGTCLCPYAEHDHFNRRSWEACSLVTISCLDRHKQQCIIATLGLLVLLVPCVSQSVKSLSLVSETSLQPEVCPEHNVDLLKSSARTFN